MIMMMLTMMAYLMRQMEQRTIMGTRTMQTMMGTSTCCREAGEYSLRLGDRLVTVHCSARRLNSYPQIVHKLKLLRLIAFEVSTNY